MTAAKGVPNAPAVLAVPAHALGQWRALGEALRDRGPAACVGAADPDTWWSTCSASVARSACTSCPVRPECAAYAVAAGEREGMWGAMTPEERAR